MIACLTQLFLAFPLISSNYQSIRTLSQIFQLMPSSVLMPLVITRKNNHHHKVASQHGDFLQGEMKGKKIIAYKHHQRSCLT